MKEFDEAVEREIFFDHQKIEDDGEKSYKNLLLYIVGALNLGVSLKKIKSHINKSPLEKGLKDNLLKTINAQQFAILGKKKKFDLNNIGFMGFTFKEAIKKREEKVKEKAVVFMAVSEQLIRENKKPLIKEELKKYEHNREVWWDTQTKEARNYAYLENDSFEKGIDGWVSVAILDKRTSAICAGLHNKFYSIKDFKDRSELPNLPPRHPRCRSIIITAVKGVNIEEYKGQNIDKFMQRNPETAKKFMGIKKFKLLKEGKFKIKSFIDIKREKFLTNDEIIEKFSLQKRKS